MAEAIFMRVRRMISASVEDVVDAMERAGGTSIMREAIREVERAIDDVRAEHEAATTRRLQAVRQQKMFRDKLSGLEEKARFAIGENRDDLAEAAVSRQIEFEVQAERLDGVQAEAAEEERRLDECLAALKTRKERMEEELAAFEAARRDAAFGGDGPTRPDRRAEHRVQQAEEAFDRAMAGVGGVSAVSRTDAQAAAKVAEIDAMQKTAKVAQRMATLRAAREAR
jgi:phage shock protein A